MGWGVFWRETALARSACAEPLCGALARILSKKPLTDCEEALRGVLVQSVCASLCGALVRSFWYLPCGRPKMMMKARTQIKRGIHRLQTLLSAYLRQGTVRGAILDLGRRWGWE